MARALVPCAAAPCAGLGNTGAGTPAGSPCGVSAAQFICDACAAAPGEVTVLALASLTNVALALRHDPALARTLGSLVVLGGAFNCMGNVNPAAEANIWHDPEAADEALGALPDGVARVVGLDVTQSSIMSAAALDTLRDAGGVQARSDCCPVFHADACPGVPGAGRFSAYCWSICQFYKAYHTRSVGLDGIFLHDPTALVAVLQPQLFGWQDGGVRVACEGVARGRTMMDAGTKKCAPSVHVCALSVLKADAHAVRSWVSANDWTGRPKVSVALSLDAPAVLQVVTDLLSK
jgi:uridine nucleosidase